MMLDTEAHPLARLKGSELLGKSEGDFVDRLEHSGPGGKNIRISINGIVK
jgi:hypothetical protein